MSFFVKTEFQAAQHCLLVTKRCSAALYALHSWAQQCIIWQYPTWNPQIRARLCVFLFNLLHNLSCTHSRLYLNTVTLSPRHLSTLSVKRQAHHLVVKDCWSNLYTSFFELLLKKINEGNYKNVFALYRLIINIVLIFQCWNLY